MKFLNVFGENMFSCFDFEVQLSFALDVCCMLGAQTTWSTSNQLKTNTIEYFAVPKWLLQHISHLQFSHDETITWLVHFFSCLCEALSPVFLSTPLHALVWAAAATVHQDAVFLLSWLFNKFYKTIMYGVLSWLNTYTHTYAYYHILLLYTIYNLY